MRIIEPAVKGMRGEVAKIFFVELAQHADERVWFRARRGIGVRLVFSIAAHHDLNALGEKPGAVTQRRMVYIPLSKNSSLAEAFMEFAKLGTQHSAAS